MKADEFRAWFLGFTENLDDRPTKAQWARIKERVAEIDGKTVTERVFIDRYWSLGMYAYPSYPSYPYYQPAFYGGIGLAAQCQQGLNSASNFQQAGQNYQGLTNTTQYSSINAMHSLGQNEMKLING